MLTSMPQVALSLGMFYLLAPCFFNNTGKPLNARIAQIGVEPHLNV